MIRKVHITIAVEDHDIRGWTKPLGAFLIVKGIGGGSVETWLRTSDIVKIGGGWQKHVDQYKKEVS